MSSFLTVASFKTRYPNLPDTVTDEQIELALQDSRCFVPAGCFGCMTARAHGLATAHFLAMDGSIPGAEPGAVTSVTYGGLSKSFAVSAANPCGPCSMWSTSKYGRQFWGMRTMFASVPIAVPAPRC